MARYLTHTALALIAGIGTAAFVASPASAAVETCDQRFSVVDVNNDGRISAKEAEDWRTKVFRNLDDNDDAKISRREYLECYAGPPPAATFRTPSRYLQYRDDKSFTGMDANRDQSVDYNEYVDAARNAFRRPRGGPGVTPEEYYETLRGQAYDPYNADQDKDGMISEDEAAADVSRGFMNLDTDGDGVVSLSEWKNEKQIARAEKVFQRIDDNDDEEIEYTEWATADKARFQAKTSGNVWNLRGYHLGY